MGRQPSPTATQQHDQKHLPQQPTEDINELATSIVNESGVAELDQQFAHIYDGLCSDPAMKEFANSGELLEGRTRYLAALKLHLDKFKVATSVAEAAVRRKAEAKKYKSLDGLKDEAEKILQDGSCGAGKLLIKVHQCMTASRGDPWVFEQSVAGLEARNYIMPGAIIFKVTQLTAYQHAGSLHYEPLLDLLHPEKGSRLWDRLPAKTARECAVAIAEECIRKACPTQGKYSLSGEHYTCRLKEILAVLVNAHILSAEDLAVIEDIVKAFTDAPIHDDLAHDERLESIRRLEKGVPETSVVAATTEGPVFKVALQGVGTKLAANDPAQAGGKHMKGRKLLALMKQRIVRLSAQETREATTASPEEDLHEEILETLAEIQQIAPKVAVYAAGLEETHKDRLEFGVSTASVRKYMVQCSATLDESCGQLLRALTVNDSEASETMKIMLELYHRCKAAGPELDIAFVEMQQSCEAVLVHCGTVVALANAAMQYATAYAAKAEEGANFTDDEFTTLVRRQSTVYHTMETLMDSVRTNSKLFDVSIPQTEARYSSFMRSINVTAQGEAVYAKEAGIVKERFIDLLGKPDDSSTRQAASGIASQRIVQLQRLSRFSETPERDW